MFHLCMSDTEHASTIITVEELLNGPTSKAVSVNDPFKDVR